MRATARRSCAWIRPVVQPPGFLDENFRTRHLGFAMRAALQQQLQDLVQALLDEAGVARPAPEFTLEGPRSAQHGRFATNAAMLLAKSLRAPPRTTAAQLAERLAGEGRRAAC